MSATERTDTSIPLFGVRRKAQKFADRIEELEEALDEIGGFTLIEVCGLVEEAMVRRDELQTEIDDLASRIGHMQDIRQAIARRTELQTEINSLQGEIKELESRIVDMQDVVLLQEVGIYDYRHPLDDAVSYQDALRSLKSEIKAMTKKDGGAVIAATDWTVNGSKSEGQRLVRQTSKLLLRAYNAEADNLVRGMKPFKLDASIGRLNKAAEVISKLGQAMSIRISPHYHQLRVKELELTADFKNKKAEEKEREKEERARLRDERKAQAEIEEKRKLLEKERKHHANAIEKLRENSDDEAVERLEQELAEIDKAIEDVDYRVANVRAGYVYVISNIGSLGKGVVKIGMTRRLNPMDRVKELSDASVPFNFDVHAIFFSDDAVGVESQLHKLLADKRVNRVNFRREFFYTTPNEVKNLLLDVVGGEVLEFQELPEAIEYRQSQKIASGESPAS